jgi:hypothetical protein
MNQRHTADQYARQRSPRPNSPDALGRVLRSPAAAVGAVLVAAGFANLILNHDEKPHQSLNRVENLVYADNAANETVVLKSGVKMRKSPAFLNGGTKDGGQNNIAQTVPEGQEVKVSFPQDNDEGWLAFTPPGTKTSEFKSLEDRAEHTVWVNIAKLQADGDAIVVPFTPNGEDTSLPLRIEDNGQLSIQTEYLTNPTQVLAYTSATGIATSQQGPAEKR